MQRTAAQTQQVSAEGQWRLVWHPCDHKQAAAGDETCAHGLIRCGAALRMAVTPLGLRACKAALGCMQMKD